MQLTSRFRAGVWSLEALALVVVVLLGVLIPVYPAFSVAAIGAVCAAIAASVAPRWPDQPRRHRWTVVSAVITGIFLAGWGLVFYGRTVNFMLFATVVFVSVVALAMSDRGVSSFLLGRRTRVAVAILLVVIVAGLAADRIGDIDPDFDVLNLHRSAAEELAAGSNPYISATAPDSNPLAPEGAVFDGYVYPPTTLLAYVLADWGLGDPRWATAIALGAFLVILLQPWTSMTAQAASVRLSLAALFVSMPQLGFMIRGGWADLIALPLLLGAALLWRRYPLASAIVLGAAMSSRSYFVLALPLLLLWPDVYRWKRVGVIGAVVAATYLPFIIDDAASVLGTINGAAFHSSFRRDSMGLAGLGVDVPRWLSYLVTLLVSVWLGMRGGRSERFFMALAAIMGVAFVTGFQAFVNYWFLVAGLAVIAIATASDLRDDDVRTSDAVVRLGTASAPRTD